MALRRMEVNPLLSFAGLYGIHKLWNGCVGLRKNQNTGIRLFPRPPPRVDYDAGFQLCSQQSLRARFPAGACRPWWMHPSITTENQIEAPIEVVEGEGLASGITIDANEVTAVAEFLSETEVSVAEFVATNDGNEVQNEMASSMDAVADLRTEGEIEAAAPEELFPIQGHIETAYSGEITGAENGEIEAAAPEGFFPIQCHIETAYSGELTGAENHIETLVDDVAIPEEVVPIMNHIEALVDDVVVPEELVPIMDHIEALVESKNQIVLVDDAVKAEEVLAFESHSEVHIDAGVAKVGEDAAFGSQIEIQIDVGVAEVAANDKIEGIIGLLVSDAIDVAILEEVTVTERESRMDMQLSEVKCVTPVSKTLNSDESKGEHEQKPNKVSHGSRSSGVRGREFVEDYSEVRTRDHSSYLLPENIFSWDSGKDIEERHKINELCETPKTSKSVDLVLGNGKSEILEPEPTIPMKKQKVQESIHERVSTMTSTCVSSTRANTKALGQTQNIAFGSGRNTTKKIPTKGVLDNKKIEALKLERAASPEKQKVQGIIKKSVTGRINTASATKTNPQSLGQTQKNAFGRIKNGTSTQIATKGSVIKRLCSGSMGRVYVANTNQGKLAIKTLKSEKMSTLNESQVAMHVKLLYEEAWLLSNLKHPNVLSFKLMIPNFQDGLPGMATEFISEGSLYDCLHRKGDQRLRTWGSILSIAQQVVDAMMFLHDVGVVHFDLKSPNILMEYTSSASTVPVCKLGDFGLAMVQKFHQPFCGKIPLFSQRGTVLYMAPEVILAKCSNYTQTVQWVGEKVDVYSFGILMWELLMGRLPYNGMTVANIELEVVKGLRPYLPEPCNCGLMGFMEDCYSELKGLIEDCWAYNVQQRPNFREISGRLQRMIMLYYMSQTQNRLRP